MPADLFVYALVAAGLVFWLRSILGTRHGEERSRPDPFKGVDLTQGEGEKGAESRPVHVQAEAIKELSAHPRDSYSIGTKLAEDGLIVIAEADRDFDVHFFLEGAQDAFVMIVESFAEGDRSALRGLLGQDVYKAFDHALSEREDKNHTQLTDIHAIKSAEVIEAKLDGKRAFITVKFKADECSVTKDENGNVIVGHAEKTTEMRDIWTFARDVKSRDPAWLVVETRGGFEDDNDLIPDSH